MSRRPVFMKVAGVILNVREILWAEPERGWKPGTPNDEETDFVRVQFRRQGQKILYISADEFTAQMLRALPDD